MSFAYWFIIEDELLWLAKGDSPGISHLPELPDLTVSDPKTEFNPYLVCYLNNKPCYVAHKKFFSAPLLKNLNPTPFRQTHDILTADIFKLATKAKALLHWLHVHQFCGVCGHPTNILPDELARKCTYCAELFYPKTSPSVIVIIERGDEILLARSPRFASGVYSALAGFVEPGETAEETLEREVLEEVGLTVKNIRYFSSQYWPFPNSFMIGFFADYAKGEIKIDNIEIIDAQWFNKNNLPILPTHASIARKLIQDWLSRH